jgi:tRNA uridine 5-carboxymethylaminomethyl modification enzyme
MTIRSDNADMRLTEKGVQLCRLFVVLVSEPNNQPGRQAGVVSDQRWQAFELVRQGITDTTELLKSVSLSPQARCDKFL